MDIAKWIKANAVHVVPAYVVELTKEDAWKLLSHNHPANRDMNQPPLVRKRIELTEDMNMGRWKLTHQGLCFDHLNRLIDGQNRLRAFLDSDCETQTFLVFTGWTGDTFAALDSGATRTVIDHLHIDRGPAEYVGYIARLAQGTLRRRPRVIDVKTVYDAVKPTIDEINGLNVKRKEGISRLSVRAMFLLRYHTATNEQRLLLARQWQILHTDFVDQKPDEATRDLKAGLEKVSKIQSSQDVDELRGALAWLAFDPAQRKGIPKTNPRSGPTLFVKHRAEFVSVSRRLAGRQDVVRRPIRPKPLDSTMQAML